MTAIKIWHTYNDGGSLRHFGRPLDKFSATTAPTVGDDGTLGYSEGSEWHDSTNLKGYKCRSAATGAADWVQFYGTGAGGAGTVTSVSVVTANGVAGSVANPTTIPAITLTLGAITPTSVAALGAVTGSNLSGTNTGDQSFFNDQSILANIIFGF